MGRRRIEDVLEILESGDLGEIDGVAENAREFYERPEEAEESGVGWSILAGWMESAFRTGGFNSVIVYGKQGAGKSVYAIKVVYDLLRRLGVVPASSTSRIVFKRYMVFSASHFIGKIKNARGARLPAVIWDDAGVHGGSYLFFTDVFLAKALGDLFRVARTRVANIIFTTPSPRDLLKPFRSYDTIIVYVHEMDEVWSRAHIYKMRLLPSGDVRVQKKAMEDFRRRLRTYDEYIRIRDRYVDEAIDALEELMLVKYAERAMKRARLFEKAARLGGWRGFEAEDQGSYRDD
ncbi:DnaA-like replication initiation protein [Aeropyrum pernix spindle-shaped virus 1]|uniref:DnaA-like replication initiation protein n=1 Tax=Aeropyrum pernix spindle-shaped virus 1 TaxID=1032473 RepID=UPI000005DCE2|nr:hypothetical protein [Aeropyrum pernix]YP_009177742.1 DnaA-like replication initiation protein [Aeropyrum pernix spindle-shaped virus 1]CCD22100.1 TPA: hypothetical protein [Aeropyrum pernix spindle-shaped virus 1]